MFYVVKTPSLAKKLFPGCTWNMPRNDTVIYLTFDDGPHPSATGYVLDTLKQFDAKATFFCIGKNVAAHPGVYKRILSEGHRIGNHTNDHLDGWKTPDKEYIRNINEAAKYIDSRLFRPPYGKISRFQIRLLTAAEKARQTSVYKVVMWDVLSADFDLGISAEKCAANVTRNAGPGSIVVFHDSEKAFPRMEKALPEVLKFFINRGFRFETIREETL
ncbi:MAG TPA: polysaccharide deacetylase family protein [Flavitalea sp.]|nr:polysaccharide deacetylase family protein [Flavitalea sp.]